MGVSQFLPIEFPNKILSVFVIGVVSMSVLPFVDAATIRLVPARKRTGWRQVIFGDKTEQPSVPDASTRR